MAGPGFSLKSQKQSPQKQPQPQPGLQRPTISAEDQLNQVSRRLRVLEERYKNLQTKTQVTDQNMLSSHQKINRELRSFESELTELQTEFKAVKDGLQLVIKELKSAARKEDLQVLEKYLDLWKPVNFVTLNQVEKIVQEALEQRE